MLSLEVMSRRIYIGEPEEGVAVYAVRHFVKIHSCAVGGIFLVVVGRKTLRITGELEGLTYAVEIAVHSTFRANDRTRREGGYNVGEIEFAEESGNEVRYIVRPVAYAFFIRNSHDECPFACGAKN